LFRRIASTEKPIKRDSPTPLQQAYSVCFLFGARSKKNFYKETQGVTVSEVLSKYDIPKYTLAALADISPADLSTYLRGGYVSGSRIARIERSAEELRLCYERLERMGQATGIFLSVRPKDVQSIRNFIDWLKKNPEPVEQHQVSA
jgi:hypothetical protein